MVEYLGAALRCGAMLLALCCATHLRAEALVDPTRPPASLDALEAGGARAVSGPVLQSVLISPGRMVAIISGQAVKLGEKYGEARVVQITEGAVVLRSGKELQTLKLFPDVEKRMASSRASAQAENRRP